MEQTNKNDVRQRWKAPQVAVFICVAIFILTIVVLIGLPFFATRPLSKHDLTNLPAQK